MENLISKIIKSNPARKKHGFLPKMATSSKVSVGTWLASSFCGRFNLVANQVVAKGNTLLALDEIEILTTPLMSRKCMKFMIEACSFIAYAFAVFRRR